MVTQVTNSSDATLRGLFLDRMFRTDYPWLVSSVRRHAFRGSDPEDVASETFFQCLHLPNLLDLRDTRAMLVTIAKRLMWRSARKHEIESACIASLEHLAATSHPSEEEKYEAISMIASIDEALESCSANARAAFVRWHIDGWSHAEIAQELGVSASMVRKYLAATLLACRALMGEPR